MFDHVTVRVSNRDASRGFYETILAPLGHEISHSGEHFDEWNDFGVAQAREDRPVTRGLHVAFISRSRKQVDAFWHAGTKAGYASDGESAAGVSRQLLRLFPHRPGWQQR